MLMPYTKVLHKPLGFINLQNLCLTASDFRVRIYIFSHDNLILKFNKLNPSVLCATLR